MSNRGLPPRNGRSRRTGWTSTIATNSNSAPVLVIIGDPTTREFVRWLIQGMGLTSSLTATSRQAITATTEAPSRIEGDLDDVAEKLAGVAVLRKSWGDKVPLIVLSHRPDVAAQAAAVGAMAAVRKPMNVGALTQAIRRALANEKSIGEGKRSSEGIEAMVGGTPDFSTGTSLMELFAANERLSSLLGHFLSTHQLTFEEGHFAAIQAVTSVARAKAVKTHRAMLVLSRVGFGEDAFILLRSLFELALEVRYCARDDTGEAAQRWVDYDVVHRYQYQMLVSNDPYFQDYRQEHGPSDGSAEDIAQEMDRVQQRWRFWGKNKDGKFGQPVAHWSGKSRRQLAEQVGWASHYGGLYRLASEIAHTSVRSAERYLTINDDLVLLFKIDPSNSLLSNVLLSGHVYVSAIAANWVTFMCPQSSLSSELDQEEMDFNAMIERRWGHERVARARRIGAAQGDTGH